MEGAPRRAYDAGVWREARRRVLGRPFVWLPVAALAWRAVQLSNWLGIGAGLLGPPQQRPPAREMRTRGAARRGSVPSAREASRCWAAVLPRLQLRQCRRRSSPPPAVRDVSTSDHLDVRSARSVPCTCLHTAVAPLPVTSAPLPGCTPCVWVRAFVAPCACGGTLVSNIAWTPACLCGTVCVQWYPGENAGLGRDFTIYSTTEGIVVFEKKDDRPKVGRRRRQGGGRGRGGGRRGVAGA